MVAPERGNFFLKTFENDRSMETGNVVFNAFAKRKREKEKERNRFRSRSSCPSLFFAFSSFFLLLSLSFNYTPFVWPLWHNYDINHTYVNEHRVSDRFRKSRRLKLAYVIKYPSYYKMEYSILKLQTILNMYCAISHWTMDAPLSINQDAGKDFCSCLD